MQSRIMSRLLGWFANLFPVWVLLGGALALVQPAWFTWFRGPAIVWGLAVIMLGMGLTLSVDDFKRVLQRPRAIVIGFAAHYFIMPLLGWGIARALRLEAPLAVGLILVASCPSGTASNVVNFLARSDVALAQHNFPFLPTAPVPCAISATFHSIIESLLAGLWRLRSVQPEPVGQLPHQAPSTPPQPPSIKPCA